MYIHAISCKTEHKQKSTMLIQSYGWCCSQGQNIQYL